MTALTEIEIARLRAETPGCGNVAHFNHAGASLMPQTVINATIGHLNLEATIGGYEAADVADARLESAYDSIALLVGAHRDEIAIVENATLALDMAFYAIPFEPDDRILTSVSEYGSNVIAFLQVAKRGVRIDVIPNDEHGQVSIPDLRAMMDDRVKVVAISHMPTNGGLIQPAARIGEAIRGSKAIYLLDACQTVGQLPVDVREIGCDVLTATSRKYLRGPRGVGFLYVRQPLIERLEPPFLDNHAATWISRDEIEIRPDARRYENWESYVAGRIGMGAAIDYALGIGIDRIWETVLRQAQRLRGSLDAIAGVTTRDLGEQPGGIVTFTHDQVDADTIKIAAHVAGINIETSSVFSTRYDMEARQLPKLVRASVHCISTDEEIDRLCSLVASL